MPAVLYWICWLLVGLGALEILLALVWCLGPWDDIAEWPDDD